MIVLIITIIVVFLLFFPIKIKAKVVFNFLTNGGFISLFLFGFNAFLGKIKILPTKLAILSKKKLSYLYFFGNKTQEDFGEMFYTNLLQSIKLNDLRLIGKFGLFANCLFTSLSCGGVMMGGGIAYSLLSSFRGRVPSSIKIFPDYRDNTILLCFTSSIKLNLFVILKAFIQTICDFIKRSKKNGN